MEKKSKIRKILPWIIGLAVVAGIAFYWNYQRTLAAQTPEYIKYTLHQRDPLVLKGTAQVTEYTSIPPKLAKGDVDVITVKSGQKVKIGDTLFTYKNKQSEDSITDARRQVDKTEQAVVDAKDDLAQAKKDQTSDKSSLDKANSNLTSSRSRLRTAQKDLTQAQTDRDKDKIETLNDKIAKESDNVQKYSQDVSRYQAKVDSWKSQIKQLEKAVTQSQTAETDAKFLLERIVSNQDLKEVADIDGVVKVNEENKTNPSGSLVDILSEVSEIKASVTEYDYFRIHPNQTVQITLVATRETMDGTISTVEPLPELNQTISAPGGVASVNYAFTVSPQRPIQPGYSVEILLELNEMVVPAGAIIKDGDQTFLWAYSNGTVQKKPVQLMQKGTYWTLVEGLSEGDVIIQNPDEHLTEGAQIKVMAS